MQHPRVRYAACNALGQMATDFSPVFEKRFHDRVIPGLALLLEDHSHPRVQAHAGAALVNFFEDCPKGVLLPYLEAVVAKIEAVLNAKVRELVEKGTKLMLEQIVVTLAALADRAEEKFVDYYDRFMPCLKYIIQNASTPELQLLRGKAIECVSLIGLAVGREKVRADCRGSGHALPLSNCFAWWLSRISQQCCFVHVFRKCLAGTFAAMSSVG